MQGPADHQAALVMGNSERAWTVFYDRFYQRRESQLGVDTMTTWRTQILQKGTATVQVPAVLRQEIEAEPVAEPETVESDSESDSESEDVDDIVICISSDSE